MVKPQGESGPFGAPFSGQALGFVARPGVEQADLVVAPPHDSEVAVQQFDCVGGLALGGFPSVRVTHLDLSLEVTSPSPATTDS